MKMLYFSVYDSAVKAFLPPFAARAPGEALRSFQAACNDQSHDFRKHAADYTLFKLAEFDDASGVFDPLPAPERVRSAVECVVDDDVFPTSKEIGRDRGPRAL